MRRWRGVAWLLLTLAGCSDPLSQVAIDMILVTGLDHQLIEVNPAEVVALKAPRPGQQLHQAVGCAILTADGRFLSVVESCPEVARRLAAPSSPVEAR